MQKQVRRSASKGECKCYGVNEGGWADRAKLSKKPRIQMPRTDISEESHYCNVLTMIRLDLDHRGHKRMHRGIVIAAFINLSIDKYVDIQDNLTTSFIQGHHRGVGVL